jgi:hypothetical protein
VFKRGKENRRYIISKYITKEYTRVDDTDIRAIKNHEST